MAACIRENLPLARVAVGNLGNQSCSAMPGGILPCVEQFSRERSAASRQRPAASAWLEQRSRQTEQHYHARPHADADKPRGSTTWSIDSSITSLGNPSAPPRHPTSQPAGGRNLLPHEIGAAMEEGTFSRGGVSRMVAPRKIKPRHELDPSEGYVRGLTRARSEGPSGASASRPPLAPGLSRARSG